MGFEPIIITGGTENYAGSLNILISSITHTNPDTVCSVYCFGWRDSLIEEFQRKHEVNFKRVDISEELAESVKNNLRSGEALKMKISSILDSAIHRGNHGGVLWIDADSVITGDISKILMKLKSGSVDVMCTRRKHRTESHLNFALGVIGIANSLLGNRFIFDLNESMKSSEGVDGWFHDQLEFYNSFSRVMPRIHSFTKEEHTLKGYRNSLIYSRRESIESTPRDIAEYLEIPIKEIRFPISNIYPI